MKQPTRKNDHKTDEVPTQVKDPELVERRRHQISEAAVKLFIKDGFHKTTTRQIASAAGISIGSLYEYINSKEDVLYLVCSAIHSQVEKGVAEALEQTASGKESLAAVIREYFLVCHRMSDFILLIYQETKNLPLQWQKKVLENEIRITGIFVKVLARLVTSGDLPHLKAGAIDLMAHNIAVLGQMWTFRRWYLARYYSIEDYIKLQTDFILNLSM